MLEIEMFLTIKMYLHWNCMLMPNWIIWNETAFDIETVLTLDWIVIYRTVLTFNCVNKTCIYTKLKIVWYRTDYLHKNGFAIK